MPDDAAVSPSPHRFVLGPVIPTGWYRLGNLDAVPRNSAMAWSALGVELVWWIDNEGNVSAAEAWCPHLGAHLGHLGSIVTDPDRRDAVLRCGFHGWCFGADGSTVRSQHGSRPSSTAALRTFDTACQGSEAYAFIDVAWDGRGAPDPTEGASWPLADFGPSPQDREPDVTLPSVAELTAHQQVVLEGDFDLNHFRPVHGVEFELVDSDIGVGAPNAASVRYQTPGPRPQVVSVRLDGVSRMWEEVRIGPIRVVLTADYVTETPNRSRVAGNVSVWGPSVRAAERAAKRLSSTLGNDIGRDAAVWETRRYDAPAAFAPSDRLLVEFRRWAGRFYP